MSPLPWRASSIVSTPNRPGSIRGGNNSVSREYFVGGQVKLEGAAYFWFFSGLMLAAAFLFLIVAKLYRPVEYFHDDEEEEEQEAEAVEEAAGR